MPPMAFILVFLLGLLCSGAVAQNNQVYVTTELSRERVYVGDEIIYQVIVRGGQSNSAPRVKFPDSVRAEFRGRSSHSSTGIRVINGRNRTVTDQNFSYQYRLTALEPGVVVIPAPSIEVNGQTYDGQEASFETVFPRESNDDEIEVSISRKQLYLNETAEVECVWWIANQTNEFSLSSTSIPESFQLRGLDPTTNGRQQVGFVIGDQQVIGVVDIGHHNGEELTKLSFRFSITPTQLGEFELGPIRAVFTRHEGTGNIYRAYTQADPIQIRVIDVPTQGRPSGYDGAIGTYWLDTTAANTKVNVGDPIGLTLRITGKEPMVGVNDAPDLNLLPEFSEDFKVSSSGWREQLPRYDGMRVYETTIRALSDSVDEIPAITLPSFDPGTGDYKVYTSRPIPLEVSKVQVVTLSDALVTGGLESPDQQSESIERVTLTDSMPGLWAHDSMEDMRDQTSFSLSQVMQDPVWIGVIASGPSVFLCSFVFVAARGRMDADARAINRAWRTSKGLDKKGQHAQALRTYLSAVLHINQDALVADDAKKLGLDPYDTQAVAQCLRAELAPAYQGDGEKQAGSNKDNVRTGLLTDIHTKIKREGVPS